MSSRPSCPCPGRTLDRHLQPTILAYLADGPEHGYALADRLSGSPLMNGCSPDLPGVYRSLVALEGRGIVKHVVTASDKWTGEAFVSTDANREGMPWQVDRYTGRVSRTQTVSG